PSDGWNMSKFMFFVAIPIIVVLAVFGLVLFFCVKYKHDDTAQTQDVLDKCTAAGYPGIHMVNDMMKDYADQQIQVEPKV
ncbi:hypothetical protein ADUPG1_001288, partial [Aduncisulcus paluster]